MKILIYGLNFSPELVGIGKYSGELAAELAKWGHQVIVVTAPPYYPAWRVGSGYSAYRYQVEERENLRVIRCPLWVPARVSGFRRVLHLLSFAVSSLPKLLREARAKPDMIFTVAPALLTAPAAIHVGKQFGIPTWLHVQDFEVDAALKLGILHLKTRSLGLRLLTRFESITLRGFYRVSSISQKMVERLQAKGTLKEHTLLFPNWVDTNEIHPEAGLNEYRTFLGLEAGTIVVLYSGSMGKKQGLETLIQCARLLQEDALLCFVLCGEGPAKADLQKLASELANVHFLPLQPAEKLNALLNLADIHVLPQRADAADLVMPSKLLGMLASGKPVITGCLPGSELYHVTQQVGVVVNPEDAGALAKAVSRLACDPIRQQELGALGLAYCVKNFSKEKVISLFISQAEELIRTTLARKNTSSSGPVR